MDFIKLKKNLLFENHLTTRIKIENQKTSRDWDEIFANHIPDKGLVTTIYKECLQFYNLKVGEWFE